MNATSPLVIAPLVLVGALAAEDLPPVPGNHVFDGALWTNPHDIPGEMPFEALRLGDLTAGSELDGLALNGEDAYLLARVGEMRSQLHLAGGVRAIEVVATGGRDLAFGATIDGLVLYDLQADDGAVTVSETLVAPGVFDRLRAVSIAGQPGLAAMGAGGTDIYAWDGLSLVSYVSLAVPDVLDVSLGDYSFNAGLELVVLTDAEISILSVEDVGNPLVKLPVFPGSPALLAHAGAGAIGPEIVAWYTGRPGNLGPVVYFFNEHELSTIEPGTFQLTALHPVEWFGNGRVDLAVVGTEPSGDVAVYTLEKQSAAVALATGFHYFFSAGEDDTWKIELPESGGPDAPVSAAGDFDGDGDDDLALLSRDGSSLHRIEGERVVAESVRAHVALPTVEVGLLPDQYLLSFVLVGRDAPLHVGPLLPPGANAFELVLRVKDGLEGTTSILLTHTITDLTPNFFPGTPWVSVVLEFSHVRENDDVFQWQLRAVNTDTGQVWPSRTDAGSFNEDIQDILAEDFPLPAGWTPELAEHLGIGSTWLNPNGTGSDRRGQGGTATPPAQ